MRKFALVLPVILFALLLWLPLEAQDADPGIGGDYRQTLEKLQLQADSGIKNADLYYNIGVCYYHLGQTGAAVLWFLRAQNLNSAHKLAKENLAYVNSLIPREAPESPTPYLVRLFLDIYDFFSLNRLAVITLALALLASLCLHWLLHWPPGKERGLPVLILSVTGVLFLAFFGALLLKRHRFVNNRKAVVISQEAEVFATPSLQRRLDSLPEGYIIEVRKARESLANVILSDGTNCWVEEANIARVVPGS
ncbi:MAG: tetratricopeptide repeat protein [Candidatus Syntrophosphaera sp.]